MESCRKKSFNKNVLLTSKKKISMIIKYFTIFSQKSPFSCVIYCAKIYECLRVGGGGREKYALREARLDLNCISAIIFSLINKSEAQWRRNCGEGAAEPNRHKSSTHMHYFSPPPQLYPCCMHLFSFVELPFNLVMMINFNIRGFFMHSSPRSFWQHISANMHIF